MNKRKRKENWGEFAGTRKHSKRDGKQVSQVKATIAKNKKTLTA